MSKARFLMGLATLPLCLAHADTITDSNNVSVFGKIVRMERGQLVLDATFPDGKRTKAIDRVKLRRIEFNFKISNDGPPPKSVALHEPPPEDAKSEPRLAAPAGSTDGSTPGDAIFLRDGSRKSCPVVSIDDRSVTCSGGDTVPRTQVLSIRFGVPPK